MERTTHGKVMTSYRFPTN